MAHAEQVKADIELQIREGVWEGFRMRHMWPVNSRARVFHAARTRRIIADIRNKRLFTSE